MVEDRFNYGASLASIGGAAGQKELYSIQMLRQRSEDKEREQLIADSTEPMPNLFGGSPQYRGDF